MTSVGVVGLGVIGRAVCRALATGLDGCALVGATARDQGRGEAFLKSLATRPPYLTLDDLCTWLKVKPATVYDWVHTRYIPHVKLGRLLRFERAAIAAWVEERRCAGRPTKKIPLNIVSS